MAGAPHYHSSYPRSGDVALLCEGDVVGYEVSILRRWLDAHVGTNPLVDLWPCGTGEAIFGVSDAIGRSRPIVVIEDRDYQTPAEAALNSAAKRKRRAERGLNIAGWQTWRRNEIENYLVEPEVIAPCLANAFQCTSDEVTTILAGLLPSLACHQAFHHAWYRARHIWKGTDPAPVLPNNLTPAPLWNDSTLQANGPDFGELLGQFEQNLAVWRSRLASPSGIDELLAAAKSSYEQWKTPALDDSFWLIDWAGKDILQWLRIALTARFGWRDGAAGDRKKFTWAGLNRACRDGQDRPIEAELKPFLVRAFLDHLSDGSSGELKDEWDGIVSIFAARQKG